MVYIYSLTAQGPDPDQGSAGRSCQGPLAAEEEGWSAADALQDDPRKDCRGLFVYYNFYFV